MIRIADLRCHACDSPDIVLIDPGSLPQISPATDIVVKRGRPVRATCLCCWPPALNYQQTLFGETAP
jgi:hypothetical protein